MYNEDKYEELVEDIAKDNKLYFNKSEVEIVNE